MNKDRIELAKENLTTHKENMRKTLERRLQLAKAQNDKTHIPHPPVSQSVISDF
jgi:hypothetical protein